MTKTHLIIMIEADSEKLDTTTGPHVVNLLNQLKDSCEQAGYCELYIVKNEKAFSEFRAEIKRLNP